MPRQFGPMRRPPCARTRSSSAACLPAPSEPTSAKPAEITQSERTPDASASRAAARTALAGTQMTARSTTGCTSESVVLPGTPSTDSPRRLIGMSLSGEVPREHIAEEFAADGAAPRRRAVHGDARGSEKCPERGRHGDVVAIVDPGDIAAGRLDQQCRLDHTASHSLLHREPRRVDDSEHLVISREDLEHESLDSARASTCRQLLEQTRANSNSLHLVGNGERDFGGGGIAQAVVAR